MIVGICDDIFQDVVLLTDAARLVLTSEHQFLYEDVSLTVLPADGDGAEDLVRALEEEDRASTMSFVFVHPVRLEGPGRLPVSPARFDAFLFDVSLRGDVDVDGVRLYEALAAADGFWRDLAVVFVSQNRGVAAAQMNAVAAGRRVLEKISVREITNFLLSTLQRTCFLGPEFGRALNRCFLRGAIDALYHGLPDGEWRFRVRGLDEVRAVDLTTTEGVLRLVEDALSELRFLRELTDVEDSQVTLDALSALISESRDSWVEGGHPEGFFGFKKILDRVTERASDGWHGCSRGAFVRMESEDTVRELSTQLVPDLVRRSLSVGTISQRLREPDPRMTKAFIHRGGLASVLRDIRTHAHPAEFGVGHVVDTFGASLDAEKEFAIGLEWSHSNEFSEDRIRTAFRNQGWGRAAELCRVHLLTRMNNGNVQHFRVTRDGVFSQKGDWVSVGDEATLRMGPFSQGDGPSSLVVFVLPTFDQPARS